MELPPPGRSIVIHAAGGSRDLFPSTTREVDPRFGPGATLRVGVVVGDARDAGHSRWTIRAAGRTFETSITVARTLRV